MKSENGFQNWEAVVLAGGLGTRLRSVVEDVPKPLAPVCGRPFLEYVLEYWIGQGVKRFILSVAYKRNNSETKWWYTQYDVGTTYDIKRTYQRLSVNVGVTF